MNSLGTNFNTTNIHVLYMHFNNVNKRCYVEAAFVYFLALNVHVGAQSQWERHNIAYFTEKIAAFDKALFKN